MNRTYGFEGEAKHKHGEQAYKVCGSHRWSPSNHSQHHSSLPMFSRQVGLIPLLETHHPNRRGVAVPLSTLVSATKPPASKGKAAILSPEGLKRFFVVHGGLFSKDGVTLDDIRKIDRIGKQPGQEGIMCEYPALSTSEFTNRAVQAK